MLGISLPAKFSLPVLIRDHLRIKRLIGRQPPMALLGRPKLTDQRLRLAQSDKISGAEPGCGRVRISLRVASFNGTAYL